MSKKIPVLEIFGPTIQGEGMVIGRKTMFVRTAGCDFSCSWCDSKFTWDGSAKEDIRMMEAEAIYDKLIKIGKSFDHVTISGGNPALIKNMNTLIDFLHENNIKVALETQGSRWQDWMINIDDLTISPKPPSSSMKQDLNVLDEVIQNLDLSKQQVSLKVVIFNDEDYQFAKMIHKRYPNIPFYLQVGNPYLDETVENHTILLLERYENLINQVMDDVEMNACYVTPQLHTLIWSNKKGV
ncbi:7-carboxy-7-deazaguanine synthase QueE [Macrococcus sp. DPC7161]|uniref:7-carboxy-7-deazaguanine synthase QueE n=1 Tax=Macrococcus sp. DPC7161 TaxID=2507060 RepID=UPI00100A79C9|nr:7-carboxy-7-deazaguanine synthase QueE [Macrococcus sp. DPC7161]RXK17997.1 7-carboxy-7-deazaguanine synthase QueE [Macrococcus sp. DPC7161]